jgi:arylsulfatase A-like enzyme
MTPRHVFIRSLGIGLALTVLTHPLRAEQPASNRQPNIILIMVDDMGWSDVGCYGGELDTPHIDSLATDGLRFTRFYNNAVCGATRASLLTGLYCQQTGHRGDRWNEPKDFKKCVLVSEVLQASGYHTAMVGKWQGRDLAVKRGFNRFFGPNCQAKISYWNAVRDNDFYLDNQPWEFPKDGFFMTDAFNDHAVEFLEEAVGGEKPFFLYVGYIAPHWPLHAREETISPYRNRYRQNGWGDWRDARLKRQQEIGLLSTRALPAPVPKSIPDWSVDPNKNWQAERMAVYAAQISNVDRGVGRMLEVLQDSEKDQDTLILFLSDNGAAPNGGLAPSNSGFGFAPGTNNGSWTKDGIVIQPGSGPDLLPGPRNTFAGYGIAWATTSNTPLRDHKQSAYEGGIRTPLIVRWPQVIKAEGTLTRQPGHVIDIMATCLDVASVDYPVEFQGRHPLPIEGKSLVPILHGRERPGHDLLAWNCGRGRAIQMKNWKLVRARDDQPWELYDLQHDIGETENQAAKFPDRVRQLATEYEIWRKRVGAQ